MGNALLAYNIETILRTKFTDEDIWKLLHTLPNQVRKGFLFQLEDISLRDYLKKLKEELEVL